MPADSAVLAAYPSHPDSWNMPIQSQIASAPLSSKKKHVCPTCQKAFTTSGHLSRHARVHTGERNHKCPFPGCETRCSRQDNLQQHYRIHLSPGSRRSSASSTRSSLIQVMTNGGVRKRGVKAPSPANTTASDSPPSTPPPLEHAYLPAIHAVPELTQSNLYLPTMTSSSSASIPNSSTGHDQILSYQSSSVLGEARRASPTTYTRDTDASYAARNGYTYSSEVPAHAPYDPYTSSSAPSSQTLPPVHSIHVVDALHSQPQHNLSYPPPHQSRTLVGPSISHASIGMSHSNSPSPVPSTMSISSHGSNRSSILYGSLKHESPHPSPHMQSSGVPYSDTAPQYVDRYSNSMSGSYMSQSMDPWNSPFGGGHGMHDPRAPGARLTL